MKRLFILTTLICFCLTGWGQHLTEQQVRENIKTALAKRPIKGMRAQQQGERLTLAYTGKDAAYYVFNHADEGYVVASAYENTPIILGYVDEGQFDVNHAPDGMKWLLERMGRQLPTAARHATAHMDIAAPVAPMLGYCNWGQDEPYNGETPIKENEHCATGCVATAMAMVMRHHQWPKKSAAIPKYQQADGTVVSALKATTFDWKNIKLKYKKDAKGDSAKAVAVLMRYCGQAMGMDYHPGLSGTGDNVTYAMKQYFDYDNNAHYLQSECYSMKDWETIIYDELKNKRPVIMSGGSYASHEFVCDGYEDGYYHFNWGWEGGQNGFFLLSVLDPLVARNTEYNYTNFFYSDRMGANVGLQPNKNGSITYDQTTDGIEMVCFFNGGQTTKSYTRTKKSADFKNVELPMVFRVLNNYDYKNAELGAAIYQKGELIKILYYGTGELNSFGELRITKTVNFGAGLSDGKYSIKSVVRQKGSSKWLTPTAGNAFYIKATIASNKITLNNFDPSTMPLDYKINSVQFIGDKEVGNQIGIKLNITNNEEMGGGTIDYYDKNGNQIGWEMHAIQPYQTEDVTYFHYFWEPGEYELNFYVGNKYSTKTFLYKQNITISQPPSYPYYHSDADVTGVKVNYTYTKQKVKVGNTLTGTVYYKNPNNFPTWSYQYIHLCIGKLENYTPGDVTTSRQYRTLCLPLKLAAGEEGKLDFTFYDIDPGEYFILNGYGLAGVTIMDHDPGFQLSGDVDGDGTINVTDAMVIVDYVLGKAPSAFIFQNADMDGNGIVNITDAMLIVDYVLGRN
ncbi:MAG: C10 family peptidase [Prevotella sp.]|nr:C10 family peptidase [Prevotella sp.]MBP5507634.1 C10 family peptidase [Prevotella sp.]